jgi:hypothetical protein
VTKSNPNDAATSAPPAESTEEDYLSQAGVVFEPPPPPTLRQKIALGVMVLVTLGWLGFLLALAVKK